MKSRPLLNTPAMRSSFYDANAVGPKLVQAYNKRDELAGLMKTQNLSLPDAQMLMDEFTMNKQGMGGVGLGFSIPMVAPTAGEGIVINNNSKQSNTTVSSSNLGVADQMFSYGGVP